MLKNPQDRRAQRTAAQVKEAMYSLMETKAIHEIRVSEICKICQINRATFYDHYRDVFDLVQDMELDLLQAMQALMESVSPEELAPELVSHRFFSFWETNRVKMQLLLGSERSRQFSLRLDALIMPFFEKKIRQNYVIPEGQEQTLACAMQFVASGYYHFFIQSLSNLPKGIAEEAALCARFSDACLCALFQPKET